MPPLRYDIVLEEEGWANFQAVLLRKAACRISSRERRPSIEYFPSKFSRCPDRFELIWFSELWLVFRSTSSSQYGVRDSICSLQILCPNLRPAGAQLKGEAVFLSEWWQTPTLNCLFSIPFVQIDLGRERTPGCLDGLWNNEFAVSNSRAPFESWS